jgi:SAM-dependent methyltransferase
LKEVLKAHKLTKPKGQDVLIIGVGKSTAIRELVSAGNVVYAVDVSQKLLSIARTAGAKRIALSNDLSTLPRVDIAIAHLVLQHNIDDEVFRLINDVKLKDGGIGSYQYTTLTNDCVLTKNMVKNLNAGEQFFRSTDRMNSIVARTDKQEVVKVRTIRFRDETFSFDWNFIRFKNKDQ